jgi:hypothetical protein
MSTITRFLGRTSRIFATTAIAVGLTAGLAAPASAATPPRAKIAITQVPGTEQFKVSIVGVYPMTQADAQGYLNNMGEGGMEFRIWGHDPNGDLPRFSRRFYGLTANNTPTTAALHATADGLRYARTVVVNRGTLNEDDDWTDHVDEIYVIAKFIDGDGGIRTAKSNVFSGWF